MKNEIHHTARREAVRGLISKVGRDLASGCTISEPAEYLNRENSLGKASERYASPTSARTIVYAFVIHCSFLVFTKTL